MKVYTKTGDQGQTNLYNGTKIMKNDMHIECVGAVDELTSHLGLVKSLLDPKYEKIYSDIQAVQENLIQLMGQVAKYPVEKPVTQEMILDLEKKIDNYQSHFPRQKKFILPGEYTLTAEIDVARTIARRAERKLIAIHEKEPQNPYSLAYMNRLSDYLFTIARYIEFEKLVRKKIEEVMEKEDAVTASQMDCITLSQAKKLMDQIEQKAKSIDLPVVIAITNHQGNTIGVHVMDDALIASYDIAVNKAFTAVTTKMKTEELGKLAQPGESLYGIQFTNQGKMVIFGGGVPLQYNHKIIGGLGVSGGSAQQDSLLADYGLEILKEVMEWH